MPRKLTRTPSSAAYVLPFPAGCPFWQMDMALHCPTVSFDLLHHHEWLMARGGHYPTPIWRRSDSWPGSGRPKSLHGGVVVRTDCENDRNVLRYGVCGLHRPSPYQAVVYEACERSHTRRNDDAELDYCKSTLLYPFSSLLTRFYSNLAPSLPTARASHGAYKSLSLAPSRNLR